MMPVKLSATGTRLFSSQHKTMTGDDLLRHSREQGSEASERAKSHMIVRKLNSKSKERWQSLRQFGFCDIVA